VIIQENSDMKGFSDVRRNVAEGLDPTLIYYSQFVNYSDPHERSILYLVKPVPIQHSTPLGLAKTLYSSSVNPGPQATV
jgi:hypothetical protein